tara:strand:- start:3666 stop:11855 length:8190 start_codon:yes stop_codon:yes gene_type:complete
MANGDNKELRPGNGAGTFSDYLVGNQYVTGTPQFTLGNFSVTDSVPTKDDRDFDLGSFSEPITLSSLNIESVEESRKLVSNKLEVFVNYDRSKITNFTQFGSLKEKFRVSVLNIIRNFPAVIHVNRVGLNLLSGNTSSGYTYDPNVDESSFTVGSARLNNPFNIEFTTKGNLPVNGDNRISEYRNLTKKHTDYVISVQGNNHPILSFTPPTASTDSRLSFIVKGNPFSGASSFTATTLLDYQIKLSETKIEEVFNSLTEVEQYLLSRDTVPKYTSTFQIKKTSEDGNVIGATQLVTWPMQDDWNIMISGATFGAYLTSLYDIGDALDREKTNLISRFLTTAALKEFDTPEHKVEKVLQIYGRSFDEVKKYIEGLAYMNNVSYGRQDNVPDAILKNLAQVIGWKTPSAISENGFLESVFGLESKKEDPLYTGEVSNKTPSELDIDLYRRLILNTAYLFKSKGTRKAIEFMLRFIGAPEALIQFNEHVYVAGQRINMNNFNTTWGKMSGGTYVQEIPVRITGFTATQPSTTAPYIPTTISGYTFGTQSLVSDIPYSRKDFPVNDQGFPIVPQVGNDSWFQAGAGWFEQTLEHRGKRITDFSNSVFTGNSPTVKTKLNAFTYGEPYLERFRRFPSMMDGFDISRTVDNKKSWVEEEDRFQTRYYSLRDRGTKYFTDDERLVMNVKNVELFMNVGQGLEWDVWNYSRKYGCPFGLTALVSPPYPGLGGVDDTEVKINASTMSFFEFASQFYKILINVKNRLTIDDAKGGGYPTLQNVYDDYINNYLATCGVQSSQYTYQKMIDYCEKIGDYWIRLMEQFIPATTIWQGGVRFENSIFHRYKFPYKHDPICDDLPCLGSWVDCARPPLYDTLANHCFICEDTFSASTGYTNWSANIEINSQSYSSDIYYTSTGCTDPPPSSLWFSAMTGMLQGIQGNTADPNSGLTYYVVDTTTDNTIDLNGDGTPDIYLNNPDAILIQGPCSEAGEDLWNFNNGSDPHTYNSYQTLLERDWTTTASTTAVTAIYNFTIDTGNTPTYTFVSGHDLTSGGSSLFKPPSVTDGGGISTCWNCPGTGMTEGTVHYCVDWGFTGCTGGTSAYSATTSWSGITGNTFILSGTSWVCNEEDRPDILANQDGSMWGYDTTLFVSGITISYDQNNVSFTGAMTASSIVYSGECCETNHAGCGGWEEALTGNTVCPCETVTSYSAIFATTNQSIQITSSPTQLEFVDFWNEGLWNSAYDLGQNVIINSQGWYNSGSFGLIDGCYQLNTNMGILSFSNAAQILSYYWTFIPCSASTTNYTVPFDGGNNLWKGADCDDTTTIHVNPPVTGVTSATTSPEIFKDGIFNVGGQACYQKFYPCPEWQDPCACPPAEAQWSGPNGPIDQLLHSPFMPGECVSCWTGDTEISFVNMSPLYPFVMWGTATTYSQSSGTFGQAGTIQPGVGPCPAYCNGNGYQIHDPVNGNGFCDNMAAAFEAAQCISLCTKYDVKVCEPGLATQDKMGPNDGAAKIITQTNPKGKFNPCDPVEVTPPQPGTCECDTSVGNNTVDTSGILQVDFRRVDPSLIPTQITTMPLFGPNALAIGGGTSHPDYYEMVGGVPQEAAVAKISLCCLTTLFQYSTHQWNNLGGPGWGQISRISGQLYCDDTHYVELWLIGPGNGTFTTGDLFSWDLSYNDPLVKQNQLWMVIPDATIKNMSITEYENNQFWVTHQPVPPTVNVQLDYGIPFRIGTIGLGSDLYNIDPSFVGIWGLYNMTDDINVLNGSQDTAGSDQMSERNWYSGWNTQGGNGWGIAPEIWHCATGSNTSTSEGKAMLKTYGGLAAGNTYTFGVLWDANGGMGSSGQPPNVLEPVGTLNAGYELASLGECWSTEFEVACRDVNGTAAQYSNILFYPFDDMGTFLNQQSEIDALPIQKPCPQTSASASALRTLEQYLPQVFEYAEPLDKALSEGGTFEFDYGKFLNDKVPFAPEESLEIIKSEPYIVMNSKNLNTGLKELKYNNPEIRTMYGSEDIQTFTKDGKIEYQVGWRNEIKDENNAQFIKFPSINQRDNFEKSLKEKQIAGIESYNLFTQSKEYPIKWVSVLQWAERSIGNPWFSNSTIHTAPDGSFSGITIRPDSLYSLEEKGHAYHVPISDPATEIVGTTWSSWPQFIADKSGFTHSYTGYTDYTLSGTETTQMFDLYFSYSAFTGNTLIPLSNKSPLDGELIGIDDTKIRAAILPESLGCNGGPTDINTSEGGIVYTPNRDGKYRIQFKAVLDVKYEDESWCDYVNRFYKKEELNYSYPSNDYEYKELINSAILLKGGKVLTSSEEEISDKTLVENFEGNVANKYTNINPYWQSNPAFGYNNSGVSDFYFRIYLTNKSGQSETVLTEYTVTTSELVRSGADGFLTYDLLETDKRRNTMSCSGSTSHILHKSFDVNLDTGPIMLSGTSDSIRLKYEAYWSSNIKDTGTTKTCSFKVNLGRKEPENSMDSSSPWIRITRRPYDLPTINKELIWKKDKKGKSNIITTPGGVRKNISSIGQLYINTDEVLAPYTNPNGYISITPNNFEKQTFLDIPNKGYSGPMVLETKPGRATNLWSYTLSNEYKKNTPKITDYYINADKSIEWKDLVIRWNLPYQDRSKTTERSVFPSGDNTYVIKTTFKGKTTNAHFDHFIVMNPSENDFTERDNLTVDVQQRLKGAYNKTVTVAQPSQDCDKRVYLSSEGMIIDGQRANIKTTRYNLNTPNKTPIEGERRKLK